MELTTAPFEPAQAELVPGWVASAEDLDRWASRTDFPIRAPVLRRWQEDPDVHPLVAVTDGEPVAYGEIWEDRDEDEAGRPRPKSEPSTKVSRASTSGCACT